MIPMGDPLYAVLGCGLLLGALGGVIMNVVAIAFAIRRRGGATFALISGAASIGVYGAYLMYELSSHQYIPTWIIAGFFAPIASGLLAMIVATLRTRKAAVIAATLVACVPVGAVAAKWRANAQVVTLIEAVQSGDAATAKSLLDSGGARKDASLRQQLLLEAASRGNPRLLEILVVAGADPNIPHHGKLALNEAIRSADWMYKPATADDALHAVQVLLDRGADPDGIRGETLGPVDLAWQAGRSEIVRVLKARGAKNDLPERFESLMQASAAGDVERVKMLATGRLQNPNFQHDVTFRSPLIVAAQNGRAGVIDVLLERYRANTETTLVRLAERGAIDANQPAAFEHLARGSPGSACRLLNDAVHAGRIEFIRIALATGCPIDYQNDGKTMLDTAAEAGRSDLVRELIGLGAKQRSR
jgi:ankyrin repeat protein